MSKSLKECQNTVILMKLSLRDQILIHLELDCSKTNSEKETNVQAVQLRHILRNKPCGSRNRLERNQTI